MLKEKFMELLKERMKDGKMLSESEKEVKMKTLDEMKDVASERMGEKLKGMKKVTVASPSEEGLKEGLEKAEDVLEAKDEAEEEFAEEMPEEMMSEDDEEMGSYEDDMEMESDEDMMEEEEMSPEEIEAKIAELQMMLEEKRA